MDDQTEPSHVAFGVDTAADGTTVAVVARSGPGQPWHFETATAPPGVTDQQVRDWIAQYLPITAESPRPEPADVQPWRDTIAEWTAQQHTDPETFNLSEWQLSVLARAMRDGQVAHPTFMGKPRGWPKMSAERSRILALIDADPWRVPADGLLEYDPVHDEWRVELLRWPSDGTGGTIIVRRHAGRRQPKKHIGWGLNNPDRLTHAVFDDALWDRVSAAHLAARQGTAREQR